MIRVGVEDHGYVEDEAEEVPPRPENRERKKSLDSESESDENSDSFETEAGKTPSETKAGEMP